MIDEKLREYLSEVYPDTVVFDNPSFDKSIIGVSDNHLVYSFEKMVLELADEDNISMEESLEFIDYNTMRTLPYIDSEVRPIIVDEIYI